jgi:3-oxoacyl-[acyl-carrier protein] reductase
MMTVGSASLLTGRRALITGASRGIGRAIALRFAEAGADVAVVARTRSDLDATAVAARDLGRRTLAVPADIRRAEDIDRLVAAVHDELGPIDILVNNAAVFPTGTVLEMAPEAWDDVLDVGLRAVHRVTRAFLPDMIKADRGDIVMISSTSGKRADAEFSAYNATKFGLNGFSHALLYEVRKHNIRVTVISPSHVDTRPLPAAKMREGGKGALLRMEDVADAVLFAVALPRRALVREIELWGTNP